MHLAALPNAGTSHTLPRSHMHSLFSYFLAKDLIARDPMIRLLLANPVFSDHEL
jgi:hypothetical protein